MVLLKGNGTFGDTPTVRVKDLCSLFNTLSYCSIYAFTAIPERFTFMRLLPPVESGLLAGVVVCARLGCQQIKQMADSISMIFFFIKFVLPD
jgi:hypothetical protein